MNRHTSSGLLGAARQLSGLLTSTSPDCRPQHFENSLAFGSSETIVKPTGRVAPLYFYVKLLKFTSKHHFYIEYEVQKDLQDISAGIGIFFKKEKRCFPLI
jgi:hypothetical protein